MARHAEPGTRPEIVLSLFASRSFTMHDVRVAGADPTPGRSGPSKDVLTFAAARPRTATLLAPNGGLTTASGVSLLYRHEVTIRPTLKEQQWAITVSGRPIFEDGGTAPDSSDITVYATLDRVPTNADSPPANGHAKVATHPPASDPATRAAAMAKPLQVSQKRGQEAWADVVSLYRLALASAHDGPEVHEGLALALKEAGDLGAAIDEARVARRLRGGRAQAHEQLGLVPLPGRSLRRSPSLRARRPPYRPGMRPSSTSTPSLTRPMAPASGARRSEPGTRCSPSNQGTFRTRPT